MEEINKACEGVGAGDEAWGRRGKGLNKEIRRCACERCVCVCVCVYTCVSVCVCVYHLALSSASVSAGVCQVAGGSSGKGAAEKFNISSSTQVHL